MFQVTPCNNKSLSKSKPLDTLIHKADSSVISTLNKLNKLKHSIKKVVLNAISWLFAQETAGIATLYGKPMGKVKASPGVTEGINQPFFC